MIRFVAYIAIVPSLGWPALLAESGAGESVPLLQQLDPVQRVRVIAGLIVIISCGGLLLLVVRTGGRLTRWYIDHPLPRRPGSAGPARATPRGRAGAPPPDGPAHHTNHGTVGGDATGRAGERTETIGSGDTLTGRHARRPGPHRPGNDP
jgi:hypothetical protein